MQDRLPPLTPLQFLVLATLRDGERAGRDIRDTLARHDAKRSAAAFYQTMARLERAQLIEGSSVAIE
jgi:DNA-binding PadR family transcriptional regulator